MQQALLKITTTNVLGKNDEIIPESLDDIIKNVKKMIYDRNFVVGSKYYKEKLPIVKGILQGACLATIELVKRGEANNGIDTDKYGLLNAQATTFGKYNDFVNKLLVDLAEERKQDQKNLTELGLDESDLPLSDEEQVKLIAEPTSDTTTHNVDVETKDGGRFTFDKINYSCTIHFKDGSTKTIALVPQGSWRATALEWLKEFFEAVKVGLVKAFDIISSPFKSLYKDVKATLSKTGTKPLYDSSDLEEVKSS